MTVRRTAARIFSTTWNRPRSDTTCSMSGSPCPGARRKVVDFLRTSLVLRERGGHPLGAIRVGTLADEFGLVGLEVLRALRDSLVDVPEQRLVQGAPLVLVHVRLPSTVSSPDDENATRPSRVSRDTFTPWRAGRSRWRGSQRCSSGPASTRGSRSSRRGRRPPAPRPRPSAPLARRSSSPSSSSATAARRWRSSPATGGRTRTRSRRPPERGTRALRGRRRSSPRRASSPEASRPSRRRGVSQVLMAGELLVHDRVWIGAGSERHMAGISPLDLLRLTNARTAELS